MSQGLGQITITMVRSFSISPGARVLTNPLRYSQMLHYCFPKWKHSFLNLYIPLHLCPFIRIDPDFPTTLWVHHLETSPPTTLQPTVFSDFVIYSIWNGTLPWRVLLFPFWKCLLPYFLFFQINYVINEKSLWSSPKNSMLLPDPETIIMPCVIKTESVSLANSECPCLHHKEIAKCTQEGSSQSNWEGSLNPAL